MEDSPVLVSSVEFDEVKRGYDPEQVDNYLREVGGAVTKLKSMLREAVERAEAADARVAETLRTKAAAESQLAEAAERQAALMSALAAAEERLANPPEDEEAEALRKMLMLAQRTADNAVEEAQASAKNIVADARTKAAEVVADAETRAERLLIEAQKVADELIKEKTGALVLQVRELERRRDDLFGDVQSLVDHLNDHRQRLHDAVAHMHSLLDSPVGLRADGLPDLRTLAGESTVADRIAEMEAAEAAPAAPAPAPATPAPAPAPAPPAPVARAAEPAPAPVAAPAPAVVVHPSPAPSGGSVEGGSASMSAGPSTGSTTAVAERPEAAKVNALLEAPRAPRIEIEVVRPEPAIVAEVEPVAEPVAEAEADAVPLFDQAEVEMVEALTPEPEADEAMRRFFEEDFDAGAQAKGIFRRK